ncbi:hypothetical protein ACJX0J_019149 [Zea mays]
MTLKTGHAISLQEEIWYARFSENISTRPTGIASTLKLTSHKHKSGYRQEYPERIVSESLVKLRTRIVSFFELAAVAAAAPGTALPFPFRQHMIHTLLFAVTSLNLHTRKGTFIPHYWGIFSDINLSRNQCRVKNPTTEKKEAIIKRQATMKSFQISQAEGDVIMEDNGNLRAIFLMGLAPFFYETTRDAILISILLGYSMLAYFRARVQFSNVYKIEHNRGLFMLATGLILKMQSRYDDDATQNLRGKLLPRPSNEGPISLM